MTALSIGARRVPDSPLLFKKAEAVITLNRYQVRITGLMVTGVQDNSFLPDAIKAQYTINGQVPVYLSATKDAESFVTDVPRTAEAPAEYSIVVTLDSGRVFEYLPLSECELLSGPDGDMKFVVAWGPELCLSSVTIETTGAVR